MKYAELKAWALENAIPGLRVEKVSRSDETLRIGFKDRMELLLWSSRQEGFGFFQTREQGSGGAEFWPQLKNSELKGIQIEENDRILYLSFQYTDIYQVERRYVLIAEFTPPQTNLILSEETEAGLSIVDAIHKYSYADNPQRQILPRLIYQAPKTAFLPKPGQITYPRMVKSLRSEAAIECFNMNDFFRHYLYEVILPLRESQIQKSLCQHWQRELKKAQTKLEKQKREYEEAGRAQYWLICAETLKPLLHRIKPGDTVLRAVNYYDPELREIEIPLMADKSATQNLQYYLKKYRKAIRGREKIAENIAASETAIANIQQALKRIEQGDLDGLGSQKQVEHLGRKLELIDRLLRLRVNADYEIVIGRKAKENDFISTQLGRPHDWWFHSRIYHGAHVLLRCFARRDPDAQLIEMCSSLAAWYSKAKFSLNVPVDYTQVRYLRKPRKSAPGYVTYSNHQTCFATPRDIRTVREELKL